jgi:hypothetical protein
MRLPAEDAVIKDLWFLVFHCSQAKQAHGRRGACRCDTLCMPCHLRVYAVYAVYDVCYAC